MARTGARYREVKMHQHLTKLLHAGVVATMFQAISIIRSWYPVFLGAVVALFVGTLALVFSATIQAEELPKSSDGTVLCAGKYEYRENPPNLGRPRHTTIWNFRNFNDVDSIIIERIRLYDATGALRFDSDTDGGLPPDRNGNLLPGNVLGPHQSVQFTSDTLVLSNDPAASIPSETFFPILIDQTKNPVQFVLDWSAPRKNLALDGTTVRRRLNGDGTESGRANLICRRAP